MGDLAILCTVRGSGAQYDTVRVSQMSTQVSSVGNILSPKS